MTQTRGRALAETVGGILTAIGGSGLFALAVVENRPGLVCWWVWAGIVSLAGVSLVVFGRWPQGADVERLETLSWELEDFVRYQGSSASVAASHHDRAIVRDLRREGALVSWGWENRELLRRFVDEANTATRTVGTMRKEARRMKRLVDEARRRTNA